MKRILVFVAFLAIAACHAPVTITTPQGHAAYTADQIVLRVNELQNAAIQAQATGALPTATARTIVEFCVSADKTLAATPSGWQATVGAAWAEAKTKLPAITNPSVQAAVNAVDVILGFSGAN
jgi:hypothetical protein